eukprot:bmy_05511T0
MGEVAGGGTFINPSPGAACFYWGPGVWTLTAPGGFYVCPSRTDINHLVLRQGSEQRWSSPDLPTTPTNFGRSCRPASERGVLSSFPVEANRE